MMEANVDLQEAQKDINEALDMRPSRSIASPSGPNLPQPNEMENSIQPPAANSRESSAEDGAGSISEAGVGKASGDSAGSIDTHDHD